MERCTSTATEVQVTATATLDDTQTSATSDPVTVQNSAPEAPTLAFTPATPIEGTALQCAVAIEATDADDDPIAYRFSWSVDGAAFTEASDADLDSTVAGSAVGAGETWTCTVVAGDGDADADPVSITAVSEPDCDRDGDAYDGPQCGGPDCDDDDSSIHPRAGDQYGDGADDDCDGLDCEAALTDGVYFTVCAQASSISAADAEQACIDAGRWAVHSPRRDGECSHFESQQALWPLRPNDNQHPSRWNGCRRRRHMGAYAHRGAARIPEWGGSEPTNSYGNEHCINMIGDITWNGLWQDLGCFAGSNVDTAYSCEAR